MADAPTTHRHRNDRGTPSDMLPRMANSSAPTKQIGAGSITALILAIASFFLISWAIAFQPVAQVVSIASILIAGASLVNGRARMTVGTWIAVVAVALGVIGLIVASTASVP